jgi:protoporphyrinogen oxidase
MEKVKFLILGSGVSGLAFANFIDSNDYLIIEKEDSPGGYCKTIIQDGFTWDYSGHFFHFRDSKIEEFLVSRMDQNAFVKVVKKTKILYKENYIDFPFQKNIHQLDKQEFLDCLYDLHFRETQNTSPSNFKEMVYKNCGKSISEAFLIPYNEKLYACDLSNLDADAMGRFFPKTNIDDIIKNFKYPESKSYNDVFTYPKGGAIEYISALLKDIDLKKIAFNECVEKIDPIKKIAFTKHRQIQYENLISSVPFPKLLDYLSITEGRNILSSNKVLVFNLGFDKKGDSENHWVYFPEKKYRFYRIGYYDNIVQQNRMSLYVEIGMKTEDTFDKENELKIVLSHLKEAKIITDHKLISYHSIIMNPAYVHINKESQQLFETCSLQFNSQNIYSIGRYGGWKYCSIEDNIIEAKVLATKINNTPKKCAE